MDRFIGDQQRALNRTVLTMATDIHRQSAILAPKDTRALVNSGKINKEKNASYNVEYGSTKVPYARRRHFENKKNPHTLKYLERAGKNVVRDVKRYLPKI